MFWQKQTIKDIIQIKLNTYKIMNHSIFYFLIFWILIWFCHQFILILYCSVFYYFSASPSDDLLLETIFSVKLNSWSSCWENGCHRWQSRRTLILFSLGLNIRIGFLTSLTSYWFTLDCFHFIWYQLPIIKLNHSLFIELICCIIFDLIGNGLVYQENWIIFCLLISPLPNYRMLIITICYNSAIYLTTLLLAFSNRWFLGLASAVVFRLIHFIFAVFRFRFGAGSFYFYRECNCWFGYSGLNWVGLVN